MTTTAAAWRHVERNARNPEKPWELCVATPDAASPCGFKSGGPEDIPCGASGSDDWHKRSFWWQEPWLYHPHVPTRCTCGHALEAVR